MNISSKRFHIRSNGFGGYSVRDKHNHTNHTLAGKDVNFAHLARISEEEFDKFLEEKTSGDTQ